MEERRATTTSPDSLRTAPFRLVAVTLLVLALLAGGCNPHREYEAALVLSDIAAGTAPSRLKEVTAAPRRTAVGLPVGGRTVGGDLYLAVARPHAAVLLLPGAAEKGKDDPRLQAFANSLARGGFAVLVPDLERFRSLKVSSDDISSVADAFAWLSARPDLAPEGRAGIFAFSYACGPAILASFDPRISARVRFIMAVGGYYDVKEVLIFFTTGYYMKEGRLVHMEPNSYGKWIFVLSNIDRLSDPSDRALFQELANLKLADLNAPSADLTARLTPEGKVLYDFIENRDPALAPSLMSGLPEQIRREIKILDLSRYDLMKTRTRFILVHGYDDDIIPYTQSIALQRNLPKGQAGLYLVYGLQHVDLKPRFTDKFRLWRAISALLREQELTGR